MKILTLMRILLNVCQYNADAEIYVRIGKKDYPLHHCVDHFIFKEDGTPKRAVLLVSDKNKNYYGE